jgi:2-C-methyl-D-erythritol 2,4-cyclodiphosphate synthase
MLLIISNVLKVKLEDVSIKATTTEKLGAIGRKEGIAAMAVVLVSKNLND